MTDRELLELAAKAAGYNVRWHDIWACFVHNEPHNIDNPPTPAGDRHVWVPLTDDGDAFRLAVKLNLHLKMSFDAMPPYICAGVENLKFDPDLDLQETQWLAWESCDDPLVPAEDPCAMTRRSIVRAAAEVGKGMV